MLASSSSTSQSVTGPSSPCQCLMRRDDTATQGHKKHARGYTRRHRTQTAITSTRGAGAQMESPSPPAVGRSRRDDGTGDTPCSSSAKGVGFNATALIRERSAKLPRRVSGPSCSDLGLTIIKRLRVVTPHIYDDPRPQFTSTTIFQCFKSHSI